MSIPRSAPPVPDPPPAARFERLSKIRLCLDLCDDDETDDDYCQITAEVIVVQESQTTAEVVHVDESQAQITEDSDVEEVMGLWFPADMLACHLEDVSVFRYTPWPRRLKRPELVAKPDAEASGSGGVHGCGGCALCLLGCQRRH